MSYDDVSLALATLLVARVPEDRLPELVRLVEKKDVEGTAAFLSDLLPRRAN